MTKYYKQLSVRTSMCCVAVTVLQDFRKQLLNSAPLNGALQRTFPHMPLLKAARNVMGTGSNGIRLAMLSSFERVNYGPY